MKICLGRPYFMQMVIDKKITGIPCDFPFLQRVLMRGLFPYRYNYLVVYLQLVKNFTVQHFE